VKEGRWWKRRAPSWLPAPSIAGGGAMLTKQTVQLFYYCIAPTASDKCIL